MGASGSRKVIIMALLANLGISMAKLMGAWISKSASLLAETIHSFVDCFNQIMLLIGQKKSVEPPTVRHPLGFGRESFFWSFIVAILLFSVGGVFAIYEGVHKLSEPHEVGSPILGLAILGISIVLEGISFSACIREIQKQNQFGHLWDWFRRSTSAELLVIFIEDMAALLGLVIATVCLLVSWLTGNPVWDAYGSILIGVVLVVVSVLLAIEIKSLLIGEAPAEDLQEAIGEILQEEIPGSRVLRFIALQGGPGEVLISYKIHPGRIQGAKELIDAINQVEARVKLKFPQVRWQFVEPDYHE